MSAIARTIASRSSMPMANFSGNGPTSEPRRTSSSRRKDEMWIITHRDNIENLTYDTLAGRIMHIDLATGKILGAMESPGHWITVAKNGDIFIGSLTGNVFRWYPGWLEHGLGSTEGLRPAN